MSTTSLTSHPSSSERDWYGSLLMVCVMALLAAAMLRAQPLQSANDRSRWCTVWSLVERGTYQIDEIDRKTRFSTIDKVRHRTSDDQPWHFYSSKPPLLSTLVAGLYWIERHTLGLELFAHTHTVTRLLLMIVNLLPMGLALVSLMRSLALLNVSAPARMFLLATAGLGSMLNPYLTTLNNHTPAAICVVFCISALIRLEAVRQTPRPRGPSPADFAILGFCAALSACFELPSALFGCITFLLALRSDVRLTLRWYIPAALLPLAAFFLTNWICTGGIKPFYMYYGTEKYVYVHNGVPSYWSQPRDLDANTESWPVYLFHCLVGHHGLLSLSPVLLLTLGGWWRFGLSVIRPSTRADQVARVDEVYSAQPTGTVEPAGGPTSGHRTDHCRLDLLSPVMVTGMLLTLATLSFYLTRTENYNYGGNSVALRWMLWLTPFWWIGMIPLLEAAGPHRRGWKLAVLLLAVSIVSANWSQDRPWRPSWLYEAMENAGWINYRTPRDR